MILGSASNVLAIHLSKDYTSLDITRFWICSISFHSTFVLALCTHFREFAYRTLLSFVSMLIIANHCKHRTFIYLFLFHFMCTLYSLQCTVLVDSRERIWRDPALCPRWSFRRQPVIEYLRVETKYQHTHIFISTLPHMTMGPWWSLLASKVHSPGP